MGQGLPAPADGRDSSIWLGRSLIVLAAVLWSTSGFFAKSPWFDAWPKQDRGMMLAFYRSLFSVVVLLPMIRRPVWNRQMLPMLVCFAIMVWSFMSAMVHGPAANAIWLQYLCPVWVLIVGVVWLKESVTRADVQMFVFCLSGVLLILMMELSNGGNRLATGMGILSGVAFAGVVVCLRIMGPVDAAWVISLSHLSTCLLLAPWAIQVEQSVSWQGYTALAFFGLFQMSVPYLMFMRGLRTVPSPEASVLTLLEPILVPLWVFIAWSQHPSYEAPRWWTWAGGGLILIGLVARYAPQIITYRRRTRAIAKLSAGLQPPKGHGAVTHDETRHNNAHDTH